VPSCRHKADQAALLSPRVTVVVKDKGRDIAFIPKMFKPGKYQAVRRSLPLQSLARGNTNHLTRRFPMHLGHAHNAQRYSLELMAVANHNISTVPGSFLSSKHLQYTMMN
jgi:hypothetical protein